MILPTVLSDDVVDLIALGLAMADEVTATCRSLAARGVDMDDAIQRRRR